MTATNHSVLVNPPDDNMHEKAVRPGGRGTDWRLLFDDADGAVASDRQTTFATALTGATTPAISSADPPSNVIASGLAVIDVKDRVLVGLQLIGERSGADPDGQQFTARAIGVKPLRYGTDTGAPRQRWDRSILWEGIFTVGQKEASFMPQGGTANRTGFADTVSLTSYLPSSPAALATFGKADDALTVLFDALGYQFVEIEVSRNITLDGSTSLGNCSGINGRYYLI